MVGEEEEKRRWWWFESHHKTTTTTTSNSKHSQWLHSTLAELDSKTNAMLSFIEEGNADSFAQRAETYYKKRPELISFVHDFYRAHRSLAHRFHHLKSSSSSSSSVDYSLSEPLDDAAHSEIDDPDEEVEDNDQGNASKLEQERLKLIQESDALRRQLLDKDEEKREVIRQLSLTLEALKDENLSLKRRLLRPVSLKKRSVFHLNPMFLGKLFYFGNAPSW